MSAVDPILNTPSIGNARMKSVYLSYLRPLLTRRVKACNLSALLEAMQVQFSQEPPVYTKPPDSTSAPLASQSILSRDYRSKPPPPLPTSSLPSPSMSPPPVTAPTTALSDRPAIPPKPTIPVYLPLVNARFPASQSPDQHVGGEIHAL